MYVLLFLLLYNCLILWVDYYTSLVCDVAPATSLENDASRAHTGPPAPKNASPSRPTASPTLQAAASSSRSPSYPSPEVELEDSLLPAPLQKSQRAVATAAADELLWAVIGSRRPKEPESRRTAPRREEARTQQQPALA